MAASWVRQNIWIAVQVDAQVLDGLLAVHASITDTILDRDNPSFHVTHVPTGFAFPEEFQSREVARRFAEEFCKHGEAVAELRRMGSGSKPNQRIPKNSPLVPAREAARKAVGL